MKRNQTSLKAKFILWFMHTKFYHYMLRYIVPFIRFSTYYTSFRGWQYLQGYAALQPGHFILSLDRKKLTTLLIPGAFSHAAFCRSKGEPQDWEISEMTHTDFTQSSFFDICKEADRVVICDCPLWDDAYKQKMIAKDATLVGTPYDHQFELGIAALSCSEHIFMLDEEHRLGASLEDVIGIGRLYISPTGLYHAQHCQVVWDSDQILPPSF